MRAHTVSYWSSRTDGRGGACVGDWQMAPQALGIAQNRLENGAPPYRGEKCLNSPV
jgi:hypothetical protein